MKVKQVHHLAYTKPCIQYQYLHQYLYDMHISALLIPCAESRTKILRGQIMKQRVMKLNGGGGGRISALAMKKNHGQRATTVVVTCQLFIFAHEGYHGDGFLSPSQSHRHQGYWQQCQ